MIHIDFIGGAHGNYLEFVCNRILGQVATANPTPFNALGAAHQKTYLNDTMFQCRHYSTDNIPLVDATVISIQFTTDDLLALQCISLLRAGDYNVDPEKLEIDTYHKLDNVHYQWVRENIISQYFNNQLTESYQAVADASWPKISTLAEYLLLPNYIREECEKVHNLKFYQFDADHPNCPRHILREFFRIGFLQPEIHGLVLNQAQMVYHESCRVKRFEFNKFYSLDGFLEEIQNLADWLDLPITIDTNELAALHQAFLERQPFKNSKQYCDDLIDKIVAGESFEFPKLNVIYEGYIDARLEQLLGRTIPINEDGWFTHSLQIHKL